MIDNRTIEWLLDSDVSIQHQVYRDLLDIDRPDLKEKITKEGWGARFLSLRLNNGQWGLGFYQPKWTSSHYTLLDLRHLEISTKTIEIKEIIHKIIDKDKGADGGINPSGTININISFRINQINANTSLLPSPQ